MIVGGSAPRYQNMAVLYPQSAALQSHLCEYYIVVVRICHKLIKTLKSPVWRQIGRSFLSASDMSGFQSDLDRWATSIKDEVTILTAKSIKEQTADLRLVSRNWDAERSRRKLKTYYRLLDNCSTYDYQTSWKEIRKIGNTDLFNTIATYRDWKAALQPSSTLICMGKLGSGKSVWLANMIDDLHLTARRDKQSLGYFFCRHDDVESLNARVVIGSITRQLLQQHAQDVQSHVSDECPCLRDLDDLVILLKTVLPPNCVIHLVIDGLDECNDSERDQILQVLDQFQTIRLTHVCLSFRLEADNSMRLNTKSILNCSTASIPENNPDIGYFIDAELQTCLETQRLTLGDPALIAQIRDTLLQGAQGMFLWVALQITSLCASRTDEDILEALENLPRNLPDTFARILQRSRDSEDDDLQARILGFVITARRPLTTGELREALAVVPGDVSWNPSRLMNNIYAALACCGCLITVDEEELTLRLVHHSAKAYLTGGSMPLVSSQVASSAMAHVVVTYLNYGVFDKQVSTTTVTPRVTGRKVMSDVASSFESGAVRSMALRILKSRKEADVDVENILREAVGKSRGSPAQPYGFLDYAESYLAEHLVHVSPAYERVISLLSKLLAKTKNRLAVSALIRSESHDELLYALIVRGLDVEVEDDVNGATPLIWAVSRGNVPMVSELIRRGANLEATVKCKRANGFYLPHDRRIAKLNKGATPLVEAAASGHEEIVHILIENGAKLGAKDSLGCSPLVRAIQAGAKSTIKRLLDSGGRMARDIWEVAPDITEDKVDYAPLESHPNALFLPFPLQTAVWLGDKETVSQLIEKGFTLRSWKGRGIESPLSLAVFRADLSMVKQLIMKGANLSEPRSVLFPWDTFEHKKLAIFKLLKESGAKVGGSSSIFRDVPDLDGNIILMARLVEAAREGCKEYVRFLLDGGLDVNGAPDSRTPLFAAIKRGQDEMVEFLCQQGANLEAGGYLGGYTDNITPLICAVMERNKKIVKLLLDRRVNMEVKDGGGWTPLYTAVSTGDVEIVKLLIEHGADLNSMSNGMTALMSAAERAHGSVVDELLQAGANPNIKEGGTGFRQAKDFAKDEQVREVFTRHGL